MSAAIATSDRYTTAYRVRADYESGEWLGGPGVTDETSAHADWCRRVDSDDFHYNGYQQFETDDIGRQALASESRLLRVEWVRDDQRPDHHT